jgi:hypothetical protein
MTYQVTKKQCQEQINARNYVCDRCGRKIVPLKTVNNSGEPTYWAGCMHGQKQKGAWGHFTSGVPKKIYTLAVKLVLEDDMEFGMSYEDKELGDFDYAFQNAVREACDKVRQIEWMKEEKPRYTKKKLKEMYFAKKVGKN